MDEWPTTATPLMANTLLMTSTTTSVNVVDASLPPIAYHDTNKTLISRITATLAPELNGNAKETATDANDLINNDFVQIFFCIIYTTVFVLGVFGNVLVCYVVLRNRAMQTVTNIFITNLALSDILLCVLAVPFTPLYTFMGRWAFGRTLCHLVSFAQGCSIYISTLTLTSIAIDRYFVIIYPFHPRMKLSTCIAIIISIWIVALLATLPYGMYMKVVVSEDNLTTTAIPITIINSIGSSSSSSSSVDIGGSGSSSSGTITIIPTASTIASIASITPTPLSGSMNMSELLEYSAGTATATLRNSNSMTSAYDVINVSTTRRTFAEAYKQIMVASSMTTSPETPNNSYVTTSYCEENWPSEHYRKVFGSVTTILQFGLPFIIISICYIWISIKLNARAKAKPGTKSSRREEADRDRKKRTNRMLIAMVAVFGLSWLPINVVNIFDDFYVKSNEWRFYTLLFFVAHSIAMSSTCYNPFLYAWLNENFRKEFKHVLPCFNPSNNHLLSITRGYNRSERNTCGPRLYHGNRDGTGGSLDAEDNGATQETSVHTSARDKLLIVPREATYGNGGASPVASNFNLNLKQSKSNDDTAIALNDNERLYPCRRHNNAEHDIDSGDEQTVEVKFCETNFNADITATTETDHECINFTDDIEMSKQ